MTGLALVVLAGLANILGGYLMVGRKAPFSKRALLSMVGVSAGYLISASFLGLVPEVLEEGKEYALWIVIGYMGVYVMENLFASYAHHHHGLDSHEHTLVGTLHKEEPLVSSFASMAAVMGLMIHTFLDGAGIMGAFRLRHSTGFLIFVAVMLHKIPEGGSISAIVLASKRERRDAFLASVLIGMMTVVGGLSTFVFRQFGRSWEMILISLAAGSFVFVGASNLIPATQKGEYKSTIIFVLFGVMLYYLSAVGLEQLLPGHHH